MVATKSTGEKEKNVKEAESGHHRDWGLLIIAIFKLFKGVLLLIVGIGALSLIHKDVAETAAHWADLFRVDPDNRHLHTLLLKLNVVDARRLEEISAGTFFYSALLVTEGTGLLLRKRWAEYFTIIVTASFIPMEIYELVRRLTFTRVLLLGINIAIVWYLVNRLRRPDHHSSAAVTRPGSAGDSRG
jgi:uncharacterized membrane protein (DUF2068 family)